MRRETRRNFLQNVLGATLLSWAGRRAAHAQIDDDDRYRPTPDGVIATQSRLYGPSGLSFDSSGNLYVVDQLHRRIRRIDAKTRIITTIAGTGERGLTGDGGPAIRARLDYPSNLHVDPQGNVFLTEYLADRVRRVDAKSGIIVTVAGNGEPWSSDRSREGDFATRRSIDRPVGLGSDSQGNIILSDSTRILKIDKASQRMTSLTGELRSRGGYAFPSELAIDRNDDIYFAEANTRRVRLLRPDRTLETIFTMTAEGTISHPVLDGRGSIFFIESNKISQMDLSTKRISHFAGGMRNPSGLAIDAQGNVYVSDWLSNRIYRFDRRTRNFETFAGNGQLEHPLRPLL